MQSSITSESTVPDVVCTWMPLPPTQKWLNDRLLRPAMVTVSKGPPNLANGEGGGYPTCQGEP